MNVEGAETIKKEEEAVNYSMKHEEINNQSQHQMGSSNLMQQRQKMKINKLWVNKPSTTTDSQPTNTLRIITFKRFNSHESSNRHIKNKRDMDWDKTEIKVTFYNATNWEKRVGEQPSTSTMIIFEKVFEQTR